MSTSPVFINYLSKRPTDVGTIAALLTPIYPRVNLRQVTTIEDAIKGPQLNVLIIDTASIEEEIWSKAIDALDDTPLILITDKPEQEKLKKLSKKGQFSLLNFKELKSTALLNTVHNLIERQKLARQLKASLKQLREMSTRDDLTHLYNSRFLNDILDQEMKKSKRYKSNLTLLLVGADRFKELNETYGHEACDRILIETAVLISQSVREVDTVARLSGDEFAIILPETDTHSAIKVSERIKSAIKEFPFLDGRTGITVTVSIGVAPWDITVHSTTELIDVAHRSMMEAKRRGKDSICTAKDAEDSFLAKLKEDTKLIENIKQQITILSEETKNSYFQAILKLFDNIPYYKKALFNHLERVSFYSERLAIRVGMRRDETFSIRKAGLLHDIGKVAIEERVLVKPERLSANEVSLIKQHPLIAIQILDQTLFLKNELSMILHHHEQFNGSGYPDHINGNHIPLGARIIAITEAWDTMITNQPYRDALSLDHALNEIKKGAGVQFDPELANAFTNLVACA